MFCHCYILSSSFNGSLGDQLFENVLDRSLPNFPDRHTHILVGMISPAFFKRSLKGRCYDNQFLARVGENWHLCADIPQRTGVLQHDDIQLLMARVGVQLTNYSFSHSIIVIIVIKFHGFNASLW